MGQFDYIFENIDKKKYRDVFESWVAHYKQQKMRKR